MLRFAKLGTFPPGMESSPVRRRRNPPTELTIPCEFCDTPIPHEDLIEHETGCRPDLARFNPRRSSPDSEELPCEFCANMVPASQLWRHQLSCTAAA
ncbi:hypothetical protein HUJ04_001272 [Dendroctonus ponderosae]|nr:hypothetical protein HUJ04_001272 [Dendroctonus ponderosae]